jgi:hypothetical protein
LSAIEVEVLAGTDDGLRAAGRARTELPGRRVTALAPDRGAIWALLERQALARRSEGGEWSEVARVAGGDAGCVLPTPAGLLVGGARARLWRLGDEALEAVEPFERVPGRDGWYTPWGGPPAVRSLSHDGVRTYVNVHVGGIPASSDGGRTWEPTLDVDDDAHQVLALTDGPGTVLAATARGLAISEDEGASWRFQIDGLAAVYCRAVAVAAGTCLLTASQGPRGGRSAVYRRPIANSGPFERCREGLPEWFEANIDTHCLAADGKTCAFGTREGAVYASQDAGATWQLVEEGLPPVRCLLVR